MNLTDLYKKLGAPLKNNRWSWGARSKNGDVILRNWSNLPEEFNWAKRESLSCLPVERTVAHRDVETSNGHYERLDHIRALRAGAKGYIVFCEGKVDGKKITISKANSDMLFPIESLIDKEDGTVWAKFGNPIRVSDYITAARMAREQ